MVSNMRAAAAARPVYESREPPAASAGFQGKGYQSFDGPRRQGLRLRPQAQGAQAQSPAQAAGQRNKPVLRSSNKNQNSALKDIGPKKVLKRPAANSNEMSLTDYLKQMGSDEPIIGLKHVKEFVDDQKKTFRYECTMCTEKGSAAKMGEHVTSKMHRKNYIKEHNLEEVPDKDLSKRAAAIEMVHGRGEWSVEKEEPKGLVTIDKSHLVKKIKKTKDVDMLDLTADDDKTDASGLKKDDVIVDELIITDEDEEVEANPKFFVLKQIDKLLDDEFAIASETEAMVVDSIIRKMDRALALFVDMANNEAGVEEIHLLDKDDPSADAAAVAASVAETAAEKQSKQPAAAPAAAAVAPAAAAANDGKSALAAAEALLNAKETAAAATGPASKSVEGGAVDELEL